MGSLIQQRPQAVMATAQVLFHRFYCKKSFARFSAKVNRLASSLLQPNHSQTSMSWANEPLFFPFSLQRVAASCVWLAGKLEESPRRSRHIIFVFHRMECRRENLPMEYLDAFSTVCFVHITRTLFPISYFSLKFLDDLLIFLSEKTLNLRMASVP